MFIIISPLYTWYTDPYTANLDNFFSVQPEAFFRWLDCLDWIERFISSVDMNEEKMKNHMKTRNCTCPHFMGFLGMDHGKVDNAAPFRQSKKQCPVFYAQKQL